MGDRYVSIADDGPVRRLTLTNPARKNAVPPHGWAELEAAFDEFDGSEARVLVLRGAAGDFSSGADLGMELKDGEAAGPTRNARSSQRLRTADHI